MSSSIIKHHEGRITYWEKQVARTDDKMNEENRAQCKGFLRNERNHLDLEVLKEEEAKKECKENEDQGSVSEESDESTEESSSVDGVSEG